MRTFSFTVLERHYQASPLGGNRWSFTAFGHTFADVLDFDPVAEYGDDIVAWSQFIDELLLDLGLIAVDEFSGDYVRTDELPHEPCDIAAYKRRIA